MILLYFNALSSTEMLKIVFGLKSCIARLILHESNVHIASHIINVDCSCPDSCSGEHSLVLRK